jgi:hypothetical protein
MELFEETTLFIQNHDLKKKIIHKTRICYFLLKEYTLRSKIYKKNNTNPRDKTFFESDAEIKRK